MALTACYCCACFGVMALTPLLSPLLQRSDSAATRAANNATACRPCLVCAAVAAATAAAADLVATRTMLLTHELNNGHQVSQLCPCTSAFCTWTRPHIALHIVHTLTLRRWGRTTLLKQTLQQRRIRL
jgi:hypothetical protein